MKEITVSLKRFVFKQNELFCSCAVGSFRPIVTVVRTAQHSKTVRFLHVAFDTTGESFLSGDHHGNIYVFDIGRNR